MDSENLFDFQCAVLTLETEAPVLVIFEFEWARAENSVVVDDIRSYGTFDDPIAFTLDQLAGLHGRRDAMYRAGSHTLCWGPIVAAGYRAGAAHGTFNGHRTGRGETVFLDLTGEMFRYVSPLMRTVVAGEPSADMLRMEAAVTAALEAIRTSARSGASARDVAARGLAALESVLEGHIFHHYFGYPVGIGYPPTWIESLGFFIRTDNDRPLESGMAFHLPISIRKHGEYGVNLSHTLVVEEDGARVLGSSAGPPSRSMKLSRDGRRWENSPTWATIQARRGGGSEAVRIPVSRASHRRP